MGLLDLQECELDDEMEAPAAVEREQRRATIEEVVNDDDQEEFTRAGPTTRRAAVRAAKRNDRPPAPTPLEKILERTTGYQTTGSSKNAYAPDTHVLARCSANLGQWFGGTIVEGGEDGTCRVVFLDGAKEDVSINNIRVWDRPPLSDWHRKHQGPIKSRYVADVQSKANTHRSVWQFDLETGALIAQFVSARRAVDNVPSLTDPQEVSNAAKVLSKARAATSGRFAAPPKLDAADVQEQLTVIMPSRYNSGTEEGGDENALLRPVQAVHGVFLTMTCRAGSVERKPIATPSSRCRTRRKFDFPTKEPQYGTCSRSARGGRTSPTISHAG